MTELSTGMQRRTLPALHREVSWASLLVRPGSVARGSEIEKALIGRALAGGVDLFDTAGLPEAEMMLGAAPRDGSEIVVLTTPVLAESRGSSSPTGSLQSQFEERRRRCGPGTSFVAVVGAKPLLSVQGADFLRQLNDASRVGSILGWGVRVPPDGVGPEELRVLLTAGAAVVVGDYSLLRRQPAERLLGALEGTGASWIATDPFCGGQLDGSWLEGSPVERQPSSGPMRFARMRASLEPILGMGFLTRDRKRTLPEAALRFPLLAPAVASVLCPLGRPGILSTIAAAERSLPFDSAELQTLGISPAS